MKSIGLMLLLALSASTICGQNTKPPKTQAKAPASTAELPAGAEKIREGVWKAKDKDGKSWYYVKTPFGYGRSQEDPASVTAPAPVAETLLKVTEVDGETVHFLKPNPFGGARWAKKTADLTAEEKEALDAYKAKQESQKE